MKKIARVSSTLISLLVIGLSIFGITHRQQILDFLALRNYEPSSRIVGLADETTMTDPMRRVFYIQHPQLDNKDEFRKNCPSTEASIVLGCYIQHKGIFLHDVQDQRLNGVVQVTAAHEALHAEYDRLSSDERKQVDQWTADALSNLKDDRIHKTVEQYRAKDPSVVPNELHSILGTEVRNLPPELETYYSHYFKNRSQVVAYSEKYEQTFVDLTNQVENYDKQLNSLKSHIESNQMEIEGKNNDLEQQKNRLDSLMNSGRTEEYNAAVPVFNAQVNSYNELIAETRGLINEYNSIVEKRNNIATTEQELVEAINSNIVPKQRN